MLAAVLAASAIAFAPNDLANPRVERLVASAWQAADKAAIDEKNHERDLESDREVGKRYAEEADKELKASKDTDSLARVQKIGNEIAEIANRTHIQALWGDKRFSKFNYTFKLVEGKDVNAFSLPGGYIYVYDGLVKYVESDDELAGVLAHEITHAALRHVATLQREESKLQAIQLPMILIAILSGKASAVAGTLQGTQLLTQAIGSGWSVKAEEAADYGGFQYLTQSKYNPTGMLTMMERLAIDERNRPYIDWGIYRSHPPSKERADSLMAFMKQDQIPVRRSLVTTSFRTSVKPGGDGTVQLSFGQRKLVELAGSDALARADAASTKLNNFFDNTPDLYEVEIGADGSIVWRRQVLLSLTREDATANKKELPALERQTLTNIQASLFSLGFRVWNTQ